MDSFLFLIPILLAIGVLILIYTIYQNTLKKIVEQFRTLAHELDIVYIEPKGGFLSGYPTLEGTFLGRPLKVYMYTKNYGRSRKVFTAFTIQVDNIGEGNLKLFREQIYHKIGKSFGMIDLQLGNEQFDSQYIVQSYNLAFAKEVLHGKLIERLLKSHARFKGVLELRNDEIRYKEMCQLTNDLMRKHLVDMIDLAETIANRVEESFDSHQIGH